MKITSAEVFIGGPGKNYVTLKIMTDQGVYGLGDATLNTRETLPAAYLKDYLIPCLIGKDPRNSEDIWQYFYKGAYFRRGPVAMAAIGAATNSKMAEMMEAHEDHIVFARKVLEEKAKADERFARRFEKIVAQHDANAYGESA